MKRLTINASIALALGLGLTLAMLWLLAGPPQVARADSPHYVAPNCAGVPTPCHTTIQEAVDAAVPGDEIRVATGTYTGVSARAGVTQVVYISKTVTTRGGYSADFSAWDPAAYTTTLDAGGNGRVLYISGDITPTVEALHLTGGDATGLGGDTGSGDAGGGVYVITATVTLSRNTIDGNVANTDGWADGMGGGVYLYRSDALVISNTITSNDASTSSWLDGWGGGLYAEEGAPTLRANLVLSNQASIDSFLTGGAGGGLYFANSQPTVEANQIRGNQAGGDFGTGGGVEIGGCPDFTLINNVIADNQASYGGSGLWISHISGVPSTGRLLHTTIARNQDGAGTAGVRVAGGSVVSMTNTILVKHDTGINVSFGSTATLTATLWGSGDWANGSDWGDVGTIFTGTINFWGDPLFLNPNGGDYHIAATSAAEDRGVNAGVSTDLDGTPRDANPDLGAYEASAQGVLQVVKTASATLLNPGDTVTYTVVVTNAGASGMTNVALTDTLPALQRPLSATTDKGTCSIADSGYGGRGTCDFGTLAGGQAAHITITAQVTATVPVTLPQTMRNTAQAVSDQSQTTAYADTVLQNCHARVNGALPTYAAVQAAVDAAGTGDEVWIAGTCAGASERAGLSQQVYLTRSLTLRGGYSTDFSAWDPDVYTTTLDASGQGRVVYVAGPVNVTVEALRLTGGDATTLGGAALGWGDAGGGVYAITATLTISRSYVTGNVASTSSDGFGGGVGVISATLTLVETTLANNTASGAALSTGYGGGLSGEFSTVRLERSRLENNAASMVLLGGGMGGGAFLSESTLEGNATLWLSNTTFALFGEGGGLYVAGNAPFTLTNCVLANNRADSDGSGLLVDGASGVLLHPTIARNQGSGGVSVGPYVTTTVAITNAIVVSHSVGIVVEAGSTAIVNGVLWNDNISDTVGTVQVSNEVTGAPAFVNPGAGDYHIGSGSAALDAGVDAGVSVDFDNDSRLGVPDIGADEYVQHVYLPLVLRNY